MEVAASFTEKYDFKCFKAFFFKLYAVHETIQEGIKI